jgi:hypothetical protein
MHAFTSFTFNGHTWRCYVVPRSQLHDETYMVIVDPINKYKYKGVVTKWMLNVDPVDFMRENIFSPTGSIKTIKEYRFLDEHNNPSTHPFLTGTGDNAVIHQVLELKFNQGKIVLRNEQYDLVSDEIIETMFQYLKQQPWKKKVDQIEALQKEVMMMKLSLQDEMKLMKSSLQDDMKQKLEAQKSSNSALLENSMQSLKTTLTPFAITGSTILNTGQIDLLKGWFSSWKKWKLAYRGSTQGFLASQFHAHCDNKGETLTVIKTNTNYICGGYNPQSWMSRNTYINDVRAWLFTLTNQHQAPRRLNHINGTSAIYDHVSYGPTFGANHDLCKFDLSYLIFYRYCKQLQWC